MDQLYPCIHKPYLTNCKIFKTANPAKYSEERWVSEAKLLLVMSFEYCCTLPLCRHKYNPIILGSVPLWLHTFLAALVSTFIGTVFLKPTHSYKKALGPISQSMLTMPLANFIPSPLPTVSLAYIYAHMYYTSLR